MFTKIAPLWGNAVKQFRKNPPMWLVLITIVIGGGLFLFHPTKGYLTKTPEVKQAAKQATETAKEVISPISIANADGTATDTQGLQPATGTVQPATGAMAIPADLAAKLAAAALTCSNVAVEFLDRCNTVCGDFKVPAEVGGCVDGFNKKVVANGCSTGATAAEKVTCVASVFTHDTVVAIQKEARQFAADVEKEYNEFIKPLLARTDQNAAEAASGTKVLVNESRVHYQQTSNGFAALGVSPAKINAGISKEGQQIVDQKTIELLFSESPANIKNNKGDKGKDKGSDDKTDDKGDGSDKGDKTGGGGDDKGKGDDKGSKGKKKAADPCSASVIKKNAQIILDEKQKVTDKSCAAVEKLTTQGVACFEEEQRWPIVRLDKACQRSKKGTGAKVERSWRALTTDRTQCGWGHDGNNGWESCEGGDVFGVLAGAGTTYSAWRGLVYYGAKNIQGDVGETLAEVGDKLFNIDSFGDDYGNRPRGKNPPSSGGGGNQVDACASGGSCGGPGVQVGDANTQNNQTNNALTGTPGMSTHFQNDPEGGIPSNALGQLSGVSYTNVPWKSSTPFEEPKKATGGAQSIAEVALKGPNEASAFADLASGNSGGGSFADLAGSDQKLIGPKEPIQN